MTDERDADLLNVGRQCSHPICGLVDFLPFNCQHCKKSFCQEHFKVEAHSCKDYDETKFNRVAPDCPLCKTPIAIRPGEDPNIRMDQHLERECSVMTGKSQKTSSGPRCAHCRKILFSPIRCSDCNHQFCPSHRFPGDHTCTPRSARVPQRVAGPSHSSNLLAKFDVTAKKLMQTTSTLTQTKIAPNLEANPTSSWSANPANATPSSSSTPPTASSSKPMPFSKADRLSSVSASASSISTVTTSTLATTANNVIIDTTSADPNPNNDFSNNLFSTYNVSSFIPRPIFASA